MGLTGPAVLARGASGSLADAVRAARPTLPAALVTAPDADRIEALADVLPGALSTGLGFECLLGDRPEHTDLLVRIKGAEVGRDVLGGTSPVDGLPAALAADATWSRLSALARAWGDPGSPLHRAVDNLWLEFDVPGDDGAAGAGAGAVPLPSFFLGASGGILSRLGSDPPPSPTEAYGWVTGDALPRVLGRPLASATERQLVRTMDAQPPGTNVFQIGAMLSRPSDAVRLCLTGVPPHAVVPYLTRLGWEGDGRELEALVTRLGRLADNVALDVDVADRVLGKVGLECYPSESGQPGHDERWAVFLDHLVEAGWCRADQRAALLAYPGFTPEAEGRPGARHVAAAASLLGHRATSGYARVVSHVKVTYATGSPPEAKVYLGSVHHWLTAGSTPDAPPPGPVGAGGRP